MKVLIATDTYYPQVNGASYFTQRLAYNLQKHGNTVAVVCPGESFAYTSSVINEVPTYGIRSVPILVHENFRFSLPLFRNSHIRKIIREFGPDIIHIQGHFPISRMVLKYAKAAGIPVVATNHFMPENLVHYMPLHSIVGEQAMKAAWADFANVFKDVSRVTTPTRSAASLIEPYLHRPVDAISCGIDTSLFKPGNNGAYLRERYSIPNLPSLLSVGRLDKEKNLDLVIRAFARVDSAQPLQLIIAGSGTERARLEELARELGVSDRVIFTGFVPDKDLPSLYAIAQAFIMAGTAELQSIVTMEAMATGLPVIAVNAVALPELVADGENGYLFEAGGADGLAQKITSLFSDETRRQAFGAKSLEKIQDHSIDRTVQKFESLYASVIGTSSARPE